MTGVFYFAPLAPRSSGETGSDEPNEDRLRVVSLWDEDINGERSMMVGVGLSPSSQAILFNLRENFIMKYVAAIEMFQWFVRFKKLNDLARDFEIAISGCDFFSAAMDAASTNFKDLLDRIEQACESIDRGPFHLWHICPKCRILAVGRCVKCDQREIFYRRKGVNLL